MTPKFDNLANLLMEVTPAPDPMDRTDFPVMGNEPPREFKDRRWYQDMKDSIPVKPLVDVAKAAAESRARHKKKLDDLLRYLNGLMEDEYKDQHLQHIKTVTPDDKLLDDSTEAEIHFGDLGRRWQGSVLIAHVERKTEDHNWEFIQWTYPTND